jgi:hypothetical protein
MSTKTSLIAYLFFFIKTGAEFFFLRTDSKELKLQDHETKETKKIKKTTQESNHISMFDIALRIARANSFLSFNF